ncbi:MAG: GTPase HflX [Nitrospiraceae bacterium]
MLISRRGAVETVIVGREWTEALLTLPKPRGSTQALRGVRFVNIPLKGDLVTREDAINLALHRLDLFAGLELDHEGFPQQIQLAHLIPPTPERPAYEIRPKAAFHGLVFNCGQFVEELDAHLVTAHEGHRVPDGQEGAVLVSASTSSRLEQEERLTELAELAESAGIAVLDRIVQRVTEPHAKYLMGSGKLKDVVITTLQHGASLLIVDQDLSPAQVRAIGDVTDLRVIDRTQLILDIFAQRAHTREGKVQVELAQLRYLLPRLSGQGTTLSLSRLGGGIGGRGPGETKLETDRRRVRDRIAHLERELATFARHQDQRRARRQRQAVPVVSIVGYTNAGKSTLLNVLTQSAVPAHNRLFDTLDTSSRRLRFPHDREVIVTDTVGFIQNLPKDLMGIFRTTLRELRDADVLLHVVDASSGDPTPHMTAVDDILRELDLGDIRRLIVFNKCDRIPPAEREALCRRFGAIGISAIDPTTLPPLIAELDRTLSALRRERPEAYRWWHQWQADDYQTETPVTGQESDGENNDEAEAAVVAQATPKKATRRRRTS